MAITVAIDRRRRDLSDVAEPMNRRNDGADADHRTAQAASIAHVALDDLDLVPFEVSSPLAIAREHSNTQTSGRQPLDDQGAQASASAGHEDHDRSFDESVSGALTGATCR